MTTKQKAQEETKQDVKQLLYEDMKNRQEKCSKEFHAFLEELLPKYDCILDIVEHRSMKQGSSYEIRFIPK